MNGKPSEQQFSQKTENPQIPQTFPVPSNWEDSMKDGCSGDQPL